MTFDLWVSEAQVRTYMVFEDTSTTGRYSDQTIGSNIRTAERLLQKMTNRQWQPESATKTFTTDGAAQIAIPDLRSVTSVTLQGAAMTANAGYWLVPSKQDNGVYVAVQLRAFDTGGRGYLANPEWFDRNLDRDWYRGHSSLPNDLAIASTQWGWSLTDMPDDVLHAVKVGAGFLTMRPDALLANAKQTPDGSIYDLSIWPVEFQAVVREWRAGSQAVLI